MIVLPIVGRELRVAARRSATYRTRVWAGVAAIVLAAWKCFGFAWQGMSTAMQGQSLFYTLSGLAFLYSLGIGARVTSDCVSEEKREGTLGLLFLTDLTGLDVVLGKLVASSLNAFYGLVAVLPLLAMPVLLGGVTFLEFGKMVLVLLNTLFFSLSIGLLVSVRSRNERKAMLGTVLAVVSPVLLPIVIVFFMAAVLQVFDQPSDLKPIMPFLTVNPLYSFLLLNARVMGPLMAMLPIPSWSFWVSLAAVHVASWLVLVDAALILPGVWTDWPKAGSRIQIASLREVWARWAFGNLHQRRTLRTRLLERNPYFWLVSRDRLKPAYVWLFVFSMVAVWLWGYWQDQQVMFDFFPLVPTVLLVHGFLKIWVVSEVSHRLVEDQRNGAMELLLSTPLTIDNVMTGQLMALIRQFAAPVLLLGALEALTFRGAYPLAVTLPVLLMLAADLFTLMWVAMRLSLTARSINEVLLKSCFWVLLVPWVLSLVSWPFFETAWRQFVLDNQPTTLAHRVCLWLTIGIANDAVLVLAWARPQALALFRNAGLPEPRRGRSLTLLFPSGGRTRQGAGVP